jgi:predicted CopG family antitoxin
MGFTSETAREAGRKSKRGKDKFSNEIRELLQLKAEDIINDLDVHSLSPNQMIKVLSIILPYLIIK